MAPNDTAARAADVAAKVDALVALAPPTPEAIGKILGVPLQVGSRSERYSAKIPEGTLESAELKWFKEEGSVLLLGARIDPGLPQEAMNLGKYGLLPPPIQNPEIRPEGTVAYTFKVTKDVALTFQFTRTTHRLMMVKVDWAGAAPKKKN